MKFATWLFLPLSLAACTSLEPLDTSAHDSGSDTGSTDTSSTDTSSTDTGSTDTGSTDTGSTDTGSTDTGDGCTVAIPSDAVVGNVDLVIDQPDQVVWGCKSHNISVSAPRTTLFLEPDSDAVVNNTDAVVYMKQGSRLALFQAGNQIWLEDTGDVDDQSGGSNPTTLCPTLTFVYTNAPSPHQGCP